MQWRWTIIRKSSRKSTTTAAKQTHLLNELTMPFRNGRNVRDPPSTLKYYDGPRRRRHSSVSEQRPRRKIKIGRESSHKRKSLKRSKKRSNSLKDPKERSTISRHKDPTQLRRMNSLFSPSPRRSSSLAYKFAQSHGTRDYRDGQKVRIHFLQASKKQFPEGFAEDVEILSLLLCRKCMRTF